MKTTPTMKNEKITHFGVRSGLQAGSSCWVNFVSAGQGELLRGSFLLNPGLNRQCIRNLSFEKGKLGSV
jgi:hypothetical protein